MKKRKFGLAFPEELAKVSIKSKHFTNKKLQEVNEELFFDKEILNQDTQPGIANLRKLLLVLIFVTSFLVLAARLFHLQIVEGAHTRELADSNRIQVKLIHAPRGVIYDRNDKVLAQNEPGFRLVDPESKKAKLISRDEALEMEVKNDPRLNHLEVDNLRYYPMGEKTSHITGYIGEIAGEELKLLNFKNYNIGDRIGRGGVEEYYESVLRGIDGGEVIEVDAGGKRVRVLRKTPPIPGHNLVLSIDSDFQTFVYTKLYETLKKSKSCCGVVVASHPQSGEILALVSIPSFDPSQIEESLSYSNFPFLNRVTSGVYPPGSVFKIVSSAAGLSSGKITKSTQFEDTGVISIGDSKFANWYFTQYGRTEGQVDLIKAIKRSNDIYFYKLGQIVGEEFLGNVARKFKLGSNLGIDLPGESAGLIPDNDWKVKEFNQVWYPGDTLHMAIGQGFVLLTPLQVNSLISTIATSGVFYKPSVALRITSGIEGSTIKEFKSEGEMISGISKEQIELIKEGLAQVPVAGGTAWPFFSFPIKTAGKTGTAEFGEPKTEHGVIGQYNTHAWYTSYAPADNPQIALTVLVEAGGEGSSVSAPLAKEILRWYLSPDKSKLIKDLYQVASDSAKTLGE